MLWIWMLLATVAGARDSRPGRRDRPRRPPVDDRRFRMVPIRLESRVAVREEVAAAPVFELGVQVARTERSALDLNVAISGARGIRVPGPFRSYWSGDLTADWTVRVTRWMAVGPVGGISDRVFVQQGTPIGNAFVPIVGLRSETTILHARRWSLGLAAGATVDLASTRMVLETSRIEYLELVEGQVGLRWNFGHGVAPADRKVYR